MRIVEYQPKTQTLAYRALWALSIVAGLFTLVVCALMIANNLRLKASDPIHTPALQKLVHELKASPQNEALKEQIREMDYLARQAFFTSQQFNQVAIWLLLGGAAVTVVVFKSLSSYHRTVPYPDGHDAKDDLAANALWARQSVMVVGLVLVGLALSLALPWKSPLDHAPREMTKVSTSETKVTPPTTLVAKPVSTPVATREERLKHWPNFRGAAQGHATTTNLPTQWDGMSGAGVLWKTALPLPGFGSPIIWGNRIFFSGANETNRAVYCVDADSGKILWEKPVATKIIPPAGMPEVTSDTGYAAPTMTTDGTRVFALFAAGDLAVFNFEGMPVWAVHLGVPANPYGHSSSPEVFEDMLLVQFDHKKDGFIAAFDVRTGAVRWKTARKLGSSWASPLLIEIGDRSELILVANAFVTAYDPKTGHELWQVKCLATADVAPTPVFANGLLYVAADHVKFTAINVKTRQVVWENKEQTPGVATPVAAGDWIFAGLSEGGLACWDSKTGRTLWQQETDDGFYASPVVAGQRVYQMDRTGKMFVFEANGSGYKPISQSTLGEEAVTTPAIYGQSLIIRGAKNLFRIGK